ncbi:MAG: hypothetical protein ACXQT4_00690 [Methanotrichaceae archaeon]
MASLKKSEAVHLLDHWIEHNNGHSKSFRDRAVLIEEISPEAALNVREAADLMDQCTERLAKAKEKI